MSETRCCLVPVSVCVGVLALGVMLPSTVAGQKERPEPPLVVSATMPLYPIVARMARVQGVVKVRVTTDGKRVRSVEMESGPPMLVKVTKENVLTWEFAKHRPTTFVTTFEYVIEGPDQCTYTNGTSVLKLPLDVRLTVNGLQTCDPAATIK